MVVLGGRGAGTLAGLLFGSSTNVVVACTGSDRDPAP